MEVLAKDIVDSFATGKTVGQFKVVVKGLMLHLAHLDSACVIRLHSHWKSVKDSEVRLKMKQRSTNYRDRSSSYCRSHLHVKFYKKLERIYKHAATDEVLLMHLLKHLNDPLLSINSREYQSRLEEAQTFEEVDSILKEHNSYLEDYLTSLF